MRVYLDGRENLSEFAARITSRPLVLPHQKEDATRNFGRKWEKNREKKGQRNQIEKRERLRLVNISGSEKNFSSSCVVRVVEPGKLDVAESPERHTQHVFPCKNIIFRLLFLSFFWVVVYYFFPCWWIESSRRTNDGPSSITDRSSSRMAC